MEERTCVHCGEPLPPHARPHRRFCDNRCKLAAKRERKRREAGTWERSCDRCGGLLPPGAHPLLRFCRDCKLAIKREDMRARYVAHRPEREARPPRLCLSCGAEIRRNKSFCDQTCRRAYYDHQAPLTKVCRDCGQVKLLEDFYRHDETKDGRNAYCKPCHNARGRRNARANPKATNAAARRSYWKNREAWLERNRQYKKRNRARASERQRLREARRHGVQFIESVDRLVLLEQSNGLCGICGEPVDPDNFHVDHILPLSRGGEHSYVNTQVAHPSCNIRKYNLSAPHSVAA